jgi:hypothetical protein
MFDCEARGRQDIKNIGTVRMYFLNGLRPEFAADERRRVPNERFAQYYCERFGVTGERVKDASLPAFIREFLRTRHESAGLR